MFLHVPTTTASFIFHFPGKIGGGKTRLRRNNISPSPIFPTKRGRKTKTRGTEILTGSSIQNVGSCTKKTGLSNTLPYFLPYFQCTGRWEACLSFFRSMFLSFFLSFLREVSDLVPRSLRLWSRWREPSAQRRGALARRCLSIGCIRVYYNIYMYTNTYMYTYVCLYM